MTFQGVMMGCQAFNFCWRKSSFGGLLVLVGCSMLMTICSNPAKKTLLVTVRFAAKFVISLPWWNETDQAINKRQGPTPTQPFSSRRRRCDRNKKVEVLSGVHIVNFYEYQLLYFTMILAYNVAFRISDCMRSIHDDDDGVFRHQQKSSWAFIGDQVMNMITSIMEDS